MDQVPLSRPGVAQLDPEGIRDPLLEEADQLGEAALHPAKTGQLTRDRRPRLRMEPGCPRTGVDQRLDRRAGVVDGPGPRRADPADAGLQIGNPREPRVGGVSQELIEDVQPGPVVEVQEPP